MEEQRDADSIVEVYTNVFRDVVRFVPQWDTHERDLAYIRRSARERGIQFFVIELPSLGKLLDRALAEGQFPPSGIPHTYAKRHGSNFIPVFMGGLYELIFGDDGCLRDDYCIEAIRGLRQVFYLCKKLPYAFSQEALTDSVKVLFEEDALLPVPERYWEENSPSSCWPRVTFPGFARSKWYSAKLLDDGSDELVSSCLRNLDKVSSILCAELGEYKPSEWRFRHGPGAISQATGTTNKYHWYGWSDSLESVFPIADCGYHSYSSWADMENQPAQEGYIPKSRLVAVPKTYEKPRLIAAEPVEHQWCQQNCWDYLCSRVQNGWISKFVRFRDQTLNQRLCLAGSRDGTLCTVDLSSASDRVSCHAVGNFLRSHIGLLDALRATRTRILEQKLSKASPRELNLRKFSTMGSAVTFPMESLLFLAIALSATLTDRGDDITRDSILSLEESVAVFGDDIIVPSSSRNLLQRVLEVLDFKVNTSKSFSEGFFRESCGVDCFRGEFVTPTYLRTLRVDTPELVVSAVDTANNFYSNFMLYTSTHLQSTVACRHDVSMVSADSGAFGFMTRMGADRYPYIKARYKLRFNHPLQRHELRVLTVKSKTRIGRTDDDSALHQYFTERPSPFDKWEHGVRQRGQLKLAYKWVELVLPPSKEALRGTLLEPPTHKIV
ncbi:TPA_asm: RNA-directed RNA polymerase [ssRNA phage SRR6253161_4]|uniref:RNA-directed RNA polymerase n=1 Tax=ssRNA phage SRR6253161_4 TaxID=2786491 RepID=A0A8S5L4A8_9VIRU|nr:RNA-directed RNA polymerase [ssRNA phage SRR6253161_4]DAD52528.1 TPA_asm: RNA-directed RNA polymerase [ssRNA phage SRR6253161_4]